MHYLDNLKFILAESTNRLTIQVMRAILEKPGIPLELMRFSGAQYDELWRIGFITSDDRVELLNGHFIKKPESTPRHIYALLKLYQNVMMLLNRALTVCRGTISTLARGQTRP
jgi:hypothetical protein